MNKVYPILFKLSTKNKVQVWNMEQKDEQYRTISGTKDGKKVTTEWSTATSKNIGKANETTAIQQATLEIESQYKKKLAQGNYKESIDDIDEDNYFEPMLAKKYEDHPVTQKMINDGKVYSSVKIDGIRCIITNKGMFSRQGKPIISCPHIFEAVKFLFTASNEKFEDSKMVIDGELYNHDLKEDFNEIISLTRQSKPTKDDLEKSAKKIQYHIYDFPMPLTYNNRFNNIRTLLKLDDKFKDTCIKFVEGTKVTSFDHLDELYTQYIQDGYEGQMVRISEKGYENKRTSQLLKRKEFQTEEFEIVSINEGLGNRSGMAGSITYRMKDGRTFDSGIKGGVDHYISLLTNADRYIGGEGTVRFFNYTPANNGNGNMPRFPVTVAVFEGKRDV